MESGSVYNQTTLGADSGETTRQSWDDTDDANGYSVQPIQGTYGLTLGTGDDAGGTRPANFQIVSGFFTNWRLRVDIYYVSSTDLSVRLDSPPVAAGGTLSSTSGYRCAEVTVDYYDTDGTYRTLAKGRRVYAYVPAPT